MIMQINKANLELLAEATVTPIPNPKINKAPINANNILGVIVTCPIFSGFNFICPIVLFNSSLPH
jgi:hypothetical protein